MNNLNAPGDWGEYQRLVLSELADLKRGQASLSDEVAALKTGLEVQKVKAGLWGALAGAVPAGILLLLHYVTGKKQ